jgi:phenylacetic acid degradation operon negative regulatory protein
MAAMRLPSRQRAVLPHGPTKEARSGDGDQYPAWRTRREIEGERTVRETVPVQARSALFDIYGDHLRRRGGAAPVAALIRLLGAVDIAAPAVRTAVSRMVRQGWLAPVATGDGPGYQLTDRAARRLDDAYARIYRTATTPWDGRWHLLVADRPATRAGRERLAAGLGFLGYGALAGGTWLAARPHADATAVLAAEGVRAETFTAAYDGAGAGLAGRAWDLTALAAAYERFELTAADLLAEGPDASDRAAFATRTRLVHEWRKFLFLDPGLPVEVLPPEWPGLRAARLFDQAADTLSPAADRFVAGSLGSMTPATIRATIRVMTNRSDGAL